ncbi:Kar5p KNAG_0M02550 [Huiozyma naganishii CBS 8797]|uniref:Nuclear fusion protein KAR5 n=1 Tax=Huiozyma naganishii (strain ATCC MYA-139 / BCRC 22969 / CBS 8797 / KCTC 17520 / NBRC 10181 / NCYC 3082 / Yp74L-3) TaxID=1071383 RepID=J7RT31_HUIN7|nr:hypothetical protein KNAG_0M02550 [Kazachstania naganishii CBS 8797]CCK73108.1 hypothetical protein KNAG_0M02550 [Kazachstania naganishii CBS 8797]
MRSVLCIPWLVPSAVAMSADLLKLHSGSQILPNDSAYLQEMFPALKTSCVREALKPIFPRCLTEGFDTISIEAKVSVAVALSFCQFETSNLKHGCNIENTVDDIRDCMAMYGLINEWWTTYNGYYQNLYQMCDSNDISVQKEQILNTFINVTHWVNDLNDQWGDLFDDWMEEVKSGASEKIGEFNDILETDLVSLRQEAEKQQFQMTNNFHSFFEELKNLMEKEREDFLKEFHFKDGAIIDGLDRIQEAASELALEINDDLTLQVRQMKEAELQNWQDMNSITESTLLARKADQLTVGRELEGFVYDTRLLLGQLTNEIEQITQHSVKEVLDDTLSLELGNIQQNFFNSWREITNQINGELQFWNDGIVEKLTGISSSLDDMTLKVNYLESRFQRFWYMTRTIFTFLNPVYWVSMIGIFWGIKYVCPHFSVLWNFVSASFNWILVLLAVYWGGQFGSILININRV